VSEFESGFRFLEKRERALRSLKKKSLFSPFCLQVFCRKVYVSHYGCIPPFRGDSRVCSGWKSLYLCFFLRMVNFSSFGEARNSLPLQIDDNPHEGIIPKRVAFPLPLGSPLTAFSSPAPPSGADTSSGGNQEGFFPSIFLDWLIPRKAPLSLDVLTFSRKCLLPPLILHSPPSQLVPLPWNKAFCTFLAAFPKQLKPSFHPPDEVPASPGIVYERSDFRQN